MLKGDGLTALTITTNPKSKWPLLSQILGNMCYSPVYTVSQGVKQRLGEVHTALGTIQIFIGVLALGFSGLMESTQTDIWGWEQNIIFGLAPVFIVSGIMCILMERFPSPCLVVLTAIVNMVSTGVAIGALVVYGMDLRKTYYPMWSRCYYYSSLRNYRRRSHEIVEQMRKREKEMCEHYLGYVLVMNRGFDIIMIVFVTLQLCVAISSCFLALKTLCKKKGDEKDFKMSLTVSGGDGVTMLTITSNPKNNYPLLCQILGTMCCISVCSVSQEAKQRLGPVHTALGTIQIFIGVLALAVAGLINAFLWWSSMQNNVFGLAPVFIVSGIMCILMEHFPSPCLVVFTMMNIVSSGVIIGPLVVHGIDLWETQYMGSRDEQMITIGLDIMMIVFIAFQLCVAISSCYLGLKTLSKKNGNGKSEEAPEIYKPLINKDLYIPAC